jgi:hypothetical protein
MAKTNENVRGDTFVGFRPTVFENAKYDKKKERRKAKLEIKKYEE